MLEVSLSKDALNDLVEIKSYLQPHSSKAAERILKLLFGAFELLATYPQMGHPRPDLTKRPLLFWTKERKMIIYRATAHKLEIVRVLDASRDITKIL